MIFLCGSLDHNFSRFPNKEGFLWLSDLSVPDPYYVLPVLCFFFTSVIIIVYCSFLSHLALLVFIHLEFSNNGKTDNCEYPITNFSVIYPLVYHIFLPALYPCGIVWASVIYYTIWIEILNLMIRSSRYYVYLIRLLSCVWQLILEWSH